MEEEEEPTPKKDESTSARSVAPSAKAQRAQRARELGIDPTAYENSHRALSTMFPNQTASMAPAPSAKALRAQRAKQLGIDPTAYENSHRALFPGVP